MGKNNAKIIDVTSLIQAGIDPKTGLPTRVTAFLESALKDNIKKALRVVDEQDAVNRFVWHNLPDGIDGNLIERVLYYKGTGMLFMLNGRFYFLPYALSGTIDVYGRYTGVTPLPFNGKTETEGKGKDKKPKAWITGLVRKPVYDVLFDATEEDNGVYVITKEILENSCVTLYDYSRQISQTILPRKDINEPILDVMAECIPFMRTALTNETGVLGMRVNSQDEYSNVAAANETLKDAALNNKRYAPIVGNIEFQELTGGTPGESADFMQALESLDNFRLGLYGIDNGGLFQKKAHMLGAEQAMAGGGGSTGLVLQDSLTARQKFCDIVNSIWGLGISVEASENCVGDTNFDGFMSDEQDQSGVPGEQEGDVIDE